MIKGPFSPYVVLNICTHRIQCICVYIISGYRKIYLLSSTLTLFLTDTVLKSRGNHFKACSELPLNKALDNTQRPVNSSGLRLVLKHFKEHKQRAGMCNSKATVVLHCGDKGLIETHICPHGCGCQASKQVYLGGCRCDHAHSTEDSELSHHCWDAGWSEVKIQPAESHQCWFDIVDRVFKAGVKMWLIAWSL